MALYVCMIFRMVTMVSSLNKCQLVYSPLVWICNMIFFGQSSVQAFPHSCHAIK